jgi:DNA primase
VLLNEELEIRVARLPAGLDPCDFIVERGGEVFRRLVEESIGFFEFRLELARRENDQTTIEGRTAAFREVGEFAARVKDPTQRDMVVRWIADELNVNPRSVWSFVESRAESGRSRRASDERPQPKKISAHETVPGELLGVLLSRPDLLAEVVGQVPLQVMKDCAETEAVRRLLEKAEADGPPTAGSFVNSLDEERLVGVASAALAQEKARQARVSDPERNVRARLDGYLRYLQRREEKTTAASAPPEDLDDRTLMERVERLKQQDRESANKR